MVTNPLAARALHCSWRTALVTLPLTLSMPLAMAVEPCKIQVIDAENGWPVPLVELQTNHHLSYITDNAGVVAFDAPELMGTETWFTVSADGYEVAKDGFGNRGIRLTPEPGGTQTIRVKRTMLAKRLGRLTGGGIFAESQKLGAHLDWKDSGILGSDSIQIALHQGKIFWAWGDTIVPKYPLGLFHMASATTELSPLTTFEPPLQLQLNYFRDEAGAVRNVANVHPDKPGPTWVTGYVSLKDAEGRERLVGNYSKIEPPLATYLSGLCVWNDETNNFESIRVLWEKDISPKPAKAEPQGHPTFWTDERGKEWLLIGDPFPAMKMPATFEAWANPEAWEELTPQKTLQDAEGNEVKPHRGSIAWNEYRRKWVTIFGQNGGDPSYLGEIWYAEADSPFGPWGTAVKVLTHRQYSFYNPRIHAELTPEGSSVLLFEGTYTAMFSGAAVKTPRYDYNQILYRLDLDDVGLEPAQNGSN